jgi:hypothetical protein
MIAHYNILQGSYEWFEIKHGKIGGKLSPGIFTNSDTLTNKLIAGRIEDFDLPEQGYISPAMLRGMELEPYAREKVSEKYGIELMTCGWLQSVSIPIVGISPDGITRCETIQAELKCPGADNHTKWIREDIVPLEHVHQCNHAFLVNPKLERLIFASYRPESIIPLFCKEITLDTKLNVGTEKTPVLMTVQDRVDQAKEKLIKIQENVDKEVSRISF